MNYREALAWLFATQRFGIKLGLGNVRRLFAALDVEHRDARIIHVAGTNGKGSTCAMAAAICVAQGYRTGLYTSPHLITFRERIRVNGDMIGEKDVTEGLSVIGELVRPWETHPTFFETATALALRHFQQQRCEIVVLETGMGGRLDATNAATPAVSVITPIDFDHQKWLGDTLEKIASEKAGIIKPHVPVVSAPQRPEAEQVLRARAVECEAHIEFIREPVSDLPIRLRGKHQQENAALAVAALRAARIDVSQDAIARGLASVDWPARFQKVDARTVVDGAHNPAGARALVSAWREEFADERATVIAGMLRDKDVTSFWRTLLPITRELIAPKFQGERALPPSELAQILQELVPDLPVTTAASVSDSLEHARQRPAPILITGSLHFAGEALASIRGEAYEDCAQ